eukprot:COSAG01_NODE_3450_length_6083_cov_3.770555_1_plen_877_part_00
MSDDDDPYGDDPYDDPPSSSASQGSNPFGFRGEAGGKPGPTTSGLASLFAGAAAPSGNDTLRWSGAPKKPATTPAGAGSGGGAAVVRQPKASILLSLKAREVYLYVPAENRQVPQGTCGVAFLGDAALGAYTLLLYKSQEEHLARVPFTAEFKLEDSVNGLYATLVEPSTGGAPTTWTLLFQSDQEVRQYAMATVLAKYGALAGPGQIAPSVLSLDLQVGTDGELTAAPGDQLGITYTGWLRDGQDPLKPGQVFDGNTQRDKPFAFKVGKGKVIQGWEVGVQGMRKGGRRIVVIPPHLAYGDSARQGIPAKSTLIFELELVKAKFDKSANRQAPSSEAALAAAAAAAATPSGLAEGSSDGVPEPQGALAATQTDLLDRIQRIAATVPFPGSGVSHDVATERRHAEEEAAAIERARMEQLRQQAAEEKEAQERAAAERAAAERARQDEQVAEQRQAQEQQRIQAQLEQMEQMRQLQQQQMEQMRVQMQQMQSAAPPITTPGGAWQQQYGHSAAAAPPPSSGYSHFSAEDQKLTRTLSGFRKRQDELADQVSDVLGQVDDLYDKLQGTKNGGRSRGRGPQTEAISPIEMLQSLQQLVDEHGAMEQESLAKDEELSTLRQQLTEARERQAVLVEEKHQFLMQQNQVLMNQQAGQRALAELQVTKEANAREQSEIDAQLAAALKSAEGMAVVDNELARMRQTQVAALDELNLQLSKKDADLAEARSKLNEATGEEESVQLDLDSVQADIDAEQDRFAITARRGQQSDEVRRETEATQGKVEAARDELSAKSSLLLAARSESEELSSQRAHVAQELEQLRAASQSAAEAMEAEALSRAKTVLSGVYVSLGEQFADGSHFEGSIVRQAIKSAILTAMRSSSS